MALVSQLSNQGLQSEIDRLQAQVAKGGDTFIAERRIRQLKTALGSRERFAEDPSAFASQDIAQGVQAAQQRVAQRQQTAGDIKALLPEGLPTPTEMFGLLQGQERLLNARQIGEWTAQHGQQAGEALNAAAQQFLTTTQDPSLSDMQKAVAFDKFNLVKNAFSNVPEGTSKGEGVRFAVGDPGLVDQAQQRSIQIGVSSPTSNLATAAAWGAAMLSAGTLASGGLTGALSPLGTAGGTGGLTAGGPITGVLQSLGAIGPIGDIGGLQSLATTPTAGSALAGPTGAGAIPGVTEGLGAGIGGTQLGTSALGGTGAFSGFPTGLDPQQLAQAATGGGAISPTQAAGAATAAAGGSPLGGLAGALGGAALAPGAANLMEPQRIGATGIEQDILAVTDPLLQREISQQAQQAAALGGQTGGQTSAEIFRRQEQQKFGQEAIAKNALQAQLAAFQEQRQRQATENAFANAVNLARTGQVSGERTALSDLLGGATTGAALGGGTDFLGNLATQGISSAFGNIFGGQ